LHSTDVGIFDPSRLLLCSEVLEPLILPDAPTYARDAAKRIVPIGADTGAAAGKVKKRRMKMREKSRRSEAAGALATTAKSSELAMTHYTTNVS
jgi:hypothetical protein